jgi:hypothetical protein
MTEIDSITRMASAMTTSMAALDWPKVLRQVERIKGILLEATIRNNPNAIRAAAQALQDGEQRLRLQQSTPIKTDGSSVMWQLRADAGTAALAAKIRPMLPRPSNSSENRDLPDLLLEVLRSSNRAMTNTDLAVRTGKDPASIARGLAVLEQRESVSFWRSGGKRFNVAKLATTDFRDTALNGLILDLARTDNHSLQAKSQVRNLRHRTAKRRTPIENDRGVKSEAARYAQLSQGLE